MSSGNVVDFATLTVADSSVGLADASPAYTAGANVLGFVATLETAEIRWRPDGTAPTSSEGHILSVGQVLQFTDKNYTDLVKNIRFIRTGGTSGKLKITYFGR